MTTAPAPSSTGVALALRLSWSSDLGCHRPLGPVRPPACPCRALHPLPGRGRRAARRLVLLWPHLLSALPALPHASFRCPTQWSSQSPKAVGQAYTLLCSASPPAKGLDSGSPPWQLLELRWGQNGGTELGLGEGLSEEGSQQGCVGSEGRGAHPSWGWLSPVSPQSRVAVHSGRGKGNKGPERAGRPEGQDPPVLSAQCSGQGPGRQVPGCVCMPAPHSASACRVSGGCPPAARVMGCPGTGTQGPQRRWLSRVVAGRWDMTQT